MTPEQIEREREAFHAFLRTSPKFKDGHISLSPYGTGMYMNSAIQCAWDAWLARAQAERVVGVGELEAFIDAMEVSTVVPTANSTAEWENGYRNGVNVACDELRALIAKAEAGHE